MAHMNICRRCGSPFESVRNDARYCSDAHRARAFRERQHRVAAELLDDMTAALASGASESVLRELKRRAEALRGK